MNNGGSYPVDKWPLTEDELFNGHGISAHADRRPCVCGGWIEPAHIDLASVVEAIDLHNESMLHQAWRSGRET